MPFALVSAGSIEVRPTSWIWGGLIPFHAVTVVEGDPATSKSTLAYDLVARLSTGRPMPRGPSWVERLDPSQAATTIVIQGEDPPAAVRRKLAAAGADLNRVLVA